MLRPSIPPLFPLKAIGSIPGSCAEKMLLRSVGSGQFLCHQHLINAPAIEIAGCLGSRQQMVDWCTDGAQE
jgi:hypothetical protein